MMSRPAVTAAVAALLFSGSVHADVNVQTSLGKLTAALVDLDPNDGVNPSIAFNPVPLAPANPDKGAEVRVIAGAKGGDTIDSRAPIPTIDLITDAPGRATAAASLVDRVDPTQTVVNVAARASHAIGEPQDAQALVQSDFFTFVLSPHTSLVFTLPGTTFGRADDGATELFYGSSVFYATLQRPDGADADSDYAYLYNDLPFGQTSSYEHADDFALTLHLSNTGSEAWQGEASYSSSAYVYATALPVPEPASAAMLAAGVGLLAWRGRRRRT
jgi:hypothetical protein